MFEDKQIQPMFCSSGVEDSEFKNPFSRMDPDTLLEDILKYGALLFMAVGLALQVFVKVDPSSSLPAMAGILSVALAALRIFTDCTYVVDNKEKKVYYSFAVFGSATTYKVCDFSEVTKLGMKVKEARHYQKTGTSSYSYFRYTIVMEINDSIRFEVTRWDTDFKRVNAYGERLAQHLGCEFDCKGEQLSALEPNDREVPKTESDLKWAEWNDLVNPATYDVVVLAVCALTCAVVIFVDWTVIH